MSVPGVVWYLMLLHHSQTMTFDVFEGRKSGILCFYIILKREADAFVSFGGLVSYAFTSFSNKHRGSSVWQSVWYLMLLHHSQTHILISWQSEESGILCFYIILKLAYMYLLLVQSLVSYAFTSFSNNIKRTPEEERVWYLMLLHHSQTRRLYNSQDNQSGILCFYIILKLSVYVLIMQRRLVSYAFTSFSNGWTGWTSGSGVWYLMLLHHSQTIIVLLEHL